MIYATGDIHGDINRFRQKEIKALKKGDTLLVCGDFGFVWDGSKAERRQLDWIARQRYQTLFVDGTHDNLDLLEQYPIIDFCGGKARQIGKRLFYLLRGEIYEIEGKRIFAMGGGESEDMDIRTPGVSWWPNELPSTEEFSRARENLEKAGNRVDYLVTHECSTTIRDFLQMDHLHITQLGVFFDEVAQQCAFSRWVFGCYHADKPIPPSYHALYRTILKLN